MSTTILMIGFAVAAVVFLILWQIARTDLVSAKESRDYYKQEQYKAESDFRRIGALIQAKWKPIDSWSGFAEHWTFQASDEQEPRRLQEAVTRQRKLDEIAKYNLPKEYEVMDDSKITT